LTVPPNDVIWVRVEPPTFDLVGVLLSSLAFAAIAVGIAFTLGAGFGWLLIRRSRRAADDVTPLQLDIDPHRP
jgi:hypothetical protein